MIHRYDMVGCQVVRPSADGSHEFLQLLREPDDYLGRTWQSIRGRIEGNETAAQAALRELREEAGLVPVEFYRLAILETFFIPGSSAEKDIIWHCISFCAIVPPDAQVRLNAEHTDFRWIPRAEIDAHIMWASERPVVASLCRDILDNGPARPHLRLPIDAG